MDRRDITSISPALNNQSINPTSEELDKQVRDTNKTLSQKKKEIVLSDNFFDAYSYHSSKYTKCILELNKVFEMERKHPEYGIFKKNCYIEGKKNLKIRIGTHCIHFLAFSSLF